MLSPRTEAMMQQGAGQTPEELFRQGFQDLALNHATAQLDTLADSIITFKILDIDPETNSGTGTVILDHNGEEIHVPVVLSQNQIQPLDMMYVKSLDVIMPLSPEWLDEVQRTNIGAMGEAVKTPSDVPGDRDIRNVVVPPTTGRYSYASDATYHAPDALYRGPNSLRSKFHGLFSRNHKLAAFALEAYGEDIFRDMLTAREEKVAGRQEDATTSLHIMTLETETDKIKRLYGDKAPQAMQEIAMRGYSSLDDREHTELAEYVVEEGPLWLEDPAYSGFYHVYHKSGDEKLCLVFTRVYSIEDGRWHRLDASVGHRNTLPTRGRGGETYKMLLCQDKSVLVSRKPFMARQAHLTQVPESFKTMLIKREAGTPRNGQRGFFCDASSAALDAVEPVKIDTVRRDNDTGRLVVDAITYFGDRVTLIQDPNLTYTSPRCFSNMENSYDMHERGPSYRFRTQAEDKLREQRGYETGTTIFVPAHYTFVAINSVEEPETLLRNPEAVLEHHRHNLRKAGGRRLNVKNAGDGTVYVDGVSYERPDAVRKLAEDYNLRAGAATYVVEKAASCHDTQRPWVVPTSSLTALIKQAQDVMGAPPSDPAVLEMAAQAVAEELMQQQAEIQDELMDQQRTVQLQLEAIEKVLGLAGQISAMGGAPPMDPAMMDPAMMGGAPPMDPAMMDPAMMGGAPPMEEGLMSSGAPSAPMAAPQMEEPMAMEAAAELEDPEMFDAAMLASIAQQDDFKQMVGEYTPMLQQVLDKIGRLLLEMRMQRDGFESRFGAEGYTNMLSQLKTVFDTIGVILIDINEAAVDISTAG